jgi:hypothetical protein
MGRGRRETSLFWISIRDRLMEMDACCQQEFPMWNLLELLVPGGCRLGHSLDRPAKSEGGHETFVNLVG